MVWKSIKEEIRDLSQRIVTAQKPIRILDSTKHSSQFVDAFIKSKFKEIPKVEGPLYKNISWDINEKIKELQQISSDCDKLLGSTNPLGELLKKIIYEYILVCGLIQHRGNAKFHDYSRQLYGSPKDKLSSDKNTIFEMGQLLYGILSSIKNTLDDPLAEENITAEAGLKMLEERLHPYFGKDQIEIILSDGIVADAAAGGDKIKLKSGAMFSMRDINIYEVHEGWVHVGTTLNGRAQPVAKWLSVGPPRCASTQEGLAVLMEIFTFRTSVARAQRINDRIMAIAKVEDGANLIDIFEYFRTEGYNENECLQSSLRVFRGSPLEGGAPFTKDISYCKGFVENYNFMRAAIRANHPFLIPYLFVGKVHVEDIPLLYKLDKEGIVEFPKFLPPQFADINGIAVWMSFSSFFNKVDLKQVQDNYNQLFKKFL
jgi:uncharacterized protein (TIGR02421 family)